MTEYRGPLKNVKFGVSLVNRKKCLFMHGDCRVSMKDMDPWDLPRNLQKVSFGTTVNAQMYYDDGDIDIHCDDPQEGLRQLAIHALDVFNIYLYSFTSEEIYWGTSHQVLSFWLDWIKEYQETIEEIDIDQRSLAGDQLRNILEKCNATEKLALATGDLDRFHVLPPSPLTNDVIVIYPSKWVTPAHLRAWDVREIVLGDTRLAWRSVNKILKQWIRGEGFKRLKYLLVSWESKPNMDILLDGIEKIEREPDLYRTFTSEARSFQQIFGGMDFRREHDGAMATVVLVDRSDEFAVRIFFWPDRMNEEYS